MSLDECVPAAARARRASRAPCDRTTAWAARGSAARRRPDTALFGIVQGGFDPAERARSAAELTALGFDGYAVGRLCRSASRPRRRRASRPPPSTLLPADRPRYLMGVGTPGDLLRFVAMGYDLFDCVLPTRNAPERDAVHPRRQAHDPQRPSRPRPAPGRRDGARATRARRFSRGALRHLMLAREMLGAQLATLAQPALLPRT